jgi:hypothetical protein
MHDHRSRNVSVKHAAAFAAVRPFGERFGFDDPARRAGL